MPASVFASLKTEDGWGLKVFIYGQCSKAAPARISGSCSSRCSEAMSQRLGSLNACNDAIVSKSNSEAASGPKWRILVAMVTWSGLAVQNP